MSQEENLPVPTHESNEKVVSTGTNEESVGFSGSNSASTEEVNVKKPQVIDSADEIRKWEKIGWQRVGDLDNKYQYDEILIIVL